jgi:ribonucleoside-diphosphate reductase beta chain
MTPSSNDSGDVRTRTTVRDDPEHLRLITKIARLYHEQGIRQPQIAAELNMSQAKISRLLKQAVELEKEYIRDCLPVNAVGLSADEFLKYIDYIADRRLEGVGLAPLNPGIKNPLPWLAEMMDIKKEQNFFEGRVTEYQKASSLQGADDDEL